MWDGKSDLSKKAALSKWLQVVDVTSANQGILMNRFSRTLSIPALTVEEEANWFWAKTYAGDRYDFTNGTFKPDGKTDLSDVSSYFTATAFDFGAGKKLRHLTSSQMELPVTERLTMLQNSLSFSKQVMQAYL